VAFIPSKGVLMRIRLGLCLSLVVAACADKTEPADPLDTVDVDTDLPDDTDCPTATFYVDGDDDGFGDEAVEACTQPVGTVTQDGDCDDADETVFPGADEPTCSPVDRDCDGVVDATVPTDVPTLAEAVAAAADGATICLEAGRFEGPIDVEGRTLTFLGQGAEATTITGGAGPVVLRAREGSDLELRGLRIDGEGANRALQVRSASQVRVHEATLADLGCGDGCEGLAASLGGGSLVSLTDVNVVDTSLNVPGDRIGGLFHHEDAGSFNELTEVSIRGNQFVAGGAVIALLSGIDAAHSWTGVTIADNTLTGGGCVTLIEGGGTWDTVRVEGNVLQGGGEALFGFVTQELSMRRVSVLGNDVGSDDTAMGFSISADLFVLNSLFAGNTFEDGPDGDGQSDGFFASTTTRVSLDQVDIVGNAITTFAQAGIVGKVTGSGQWSMRNSQVARNSLPPDAPATVLETWNAAPTFAFVNAWDNTGPATAVNGVTPVLLSVDPMYADLTGPASGWDLQLQPGSPAIDAGEPLVLDPDGTRSDLGAHGGPDGGPW
jgi:hypothetical protein